MLVPSIYWKVGMGKILHAILVHGPRVNYDLDTISQFQGKGYNALAEIFLFRLRFHW